MKLHRFYVGERWERDIQHFADERCWVQDKELLHQWHKVLRFKPSDELVLFDGKVEILYKIYEIKKDETALHKVTELVPKSPPRRLLLAWSLLKKDKNDWVLQKATEIGVTHFAPLLSERSEKTGFNIERANKIMVEASEQCGRIDIPQIDEAQSLTSLLHTYKDAYKLYACNEQSEIVNAIASENVGVLIGPEGGWTEAELEILDKENVQRITLGDLTLRAETAAVVAATKILGMTR